MEIPKISSGDSKINKLSSKNDSINSSEEINLSPNECNYEIVDMDISQDDIPTDELETAKVIFSNFLFLQS